MTAWSDLLATALIGTARRATQPGAAAASTAGRPSTVEDPATALLDEAAAWSVYRRAGVRPASGLTEPSPAPAETIPLVGPAAAQRITSLVGVEEGGYLDEFRVALVSEWLTAAISRGRRVPPEVLPDLLTAGRRAPELVPLISAGGGARVGWLAAQNDDWAYLAGPDHDAAGSDVDSWHEGTVPERVKVLTAARRADPVAARELLVADWPRLPPDERAALLEVLATGLCPDDEEFLEGALDDRRQEVRRIAANLLSRLPESAYTKQMAVLARVSIRRPDGALVVEPPPSYTEEMRRAAISAKPPGRLMGQRAWWLEEVLAAAPLAAWTSDRYGPARAQSPAEFLALSIPDEWLSLVHRGLAMAAVRQRDAAWAAALLDVLEPQLPERPTAPNPHSYVTSLYSVLAPAEAARRATAIFRDPEPRLGRMVEHLLRACPGPWPDELARAVLAGLEAHLRHRRLLYLPDPVFRVAGLRMPSRFAAEADRVTERVGEAMPGHGRVYHFEMLARWLHLRREMIEELA